MDKLEFPRWMYGPNGEAGIFDSEDSVPKGWTSFQPIKEEGENEVVATASPNDEILKEEAVSEEATSPIEPSSEGPQEELKEEPKEEPAATPKPKKKSKK